jgi:uncharacterized protein
VPNLERRLPRSTGAPRAASAGEQPSTAERKLLYVDSSALVKLVVDEPESEALAAHLGADDALATSRLALVEVPRATGLANPSPEVRSETERLLASCVLVDVSHELLRAAAGLASDTIRTLDAIHLASALRVEPDEVVAYDRRLGAAAAERGLEVVRPGGV